MAIRKRSVAVLKRGPWTRSRPEGAPTCPGCGGRLDFSQPDPAVPTELLGSCDNLPACGEWVVFVRREGRWMISRRISAAERRNPPWPVARPSTPETAARGALG